MGWNRVAGSALPQKQFIYNLTFLYCFPYLSYLSLCPSYRKVVLVLLHYSKNCSKVCPCWLLLDFSVSSVQRPLALGALEALQHPELRVEGGVFFAAALKVQANIVDRTGGSRLQGAGKSSGRGAGVERRELAAHCCL